MDGVSVAASIVAIATAGIQVSIKVVTLASQISTASDRVSSIGNDISLTSAILHQLGDLMNQKTTNDSLTIFSKGGLETTKSSAEICQRIFQEVEKETAKASELIRGRKQRLGEKVKLSVLEKAKWPFLQPGLEVLRTDLREAKGTLMLMLQVASLALSLRVADINLSASSGVTEQQDIVRSILILQQQQQQRLHPDSGIHAQYAVDQDDDNLRAPPEAEKTDPLFSTVNSHKQPCITDAEERDGAKSQPLADATEHKMRESRRSSQFTDRRRSGTRNAEELPTGAAVSGSIEDSSHATFITSIPLRANNIGQAPGKRSFDNHSIHDDRRTGDSRSLSDDRVVELHMCSIIPEVSSWSDQIKISWIWSEIKIPGDEIRERLIKNQASGKQSVLDVLESLHASERRLVLARVEEMDTIGMTGYESGDPNFKVRMTLVSLERTEQDLQQGSLVLKAVPSFTLTLQHEIHPRGQVRDNEEVSREEFNKIAMREHKPRAEEPLGAKSWEFRYCGLEESLHRDRIPSSSGSASDNEHALPEGRDQAWPTIQYRLECSSYIPPESSNATVTLADGEESLMEGEHDVSEETSLSDKHQDMAAVNELLGKYTTLFEQAT